MKGLFPKYKNKMKVVSPTSYEESMNGTLILESEDYKGCHQGIQCQDRIKGLDVIKVYNRQGQRITFISFW